MYFPVKGRLEMVSQCPEVLVELPHGYYLLQMRI